MTDTPPPTIPSHNIFSHAEFNLGALLALAEKLRGVPCACDKTTLPKEGCMNWVIFVNFQDGVDWVFRSPRTFWPPTMTPDTTAKMLKSEAATLKYIHSRTSVPVPKVYSYSEVKDNEIGVPYILQSKAPGRPLSDYDWADQSTQLNGSKLHHSLLPISEKDRESLMHQLGVLMGALSQLSRDHIGSIFKDSEEDYHVGECLSPSLVWQGRDSLDASINRGPYSEEKHYLASLVSALEAHAKELPMSSHAFFAPMPDISGFSNFDSYRLAVRRWNYYLTVGDKVESSKNRLDYCIAGQLPQKMIPHLTTTTITANRPSPSNHGYSLSHPDLHLGNIFVDDSLRITCIIDWGSASFGPLTELLATPGLGSSISYPRRSHVDAYRSGFSRQRKTICSEVWKRSERMWYFSRLVRLLTNCDSTLFEALFEHVFNEKGDNLTVADIPRLFHELAQSKENRDLAAILHEDDFTKEQMEEYESQNFASTEKEGTNHLAVARKLTLISEMNPGFLADARLWRWVEEALK